MTLKDRDHSGGRPGGNDSDPQEGKSKETQRERNESVDKQRAKNADSKKNCRGAPHGKSALSAAQHLVDEPVYDLFSILRGFVHRHDDGFEVVRDLAGLHTKR